MSEPTAAPLAATVPHAARARSAAAIERQLSTVARILLPLGAVLLALLLWQLAVTLTRTPVFPRPAEVARGFAELQRRGVLWSYAGDSLDRKNTRLNSQSH